MHYGLRRCACDLTALAVCRPSSHTETFILARLLKALRTAAENPCGVDHFSLCAARAAPGSHHCGSTTLLLMLLFFQNRLCDGGSHVSSTSACSWRPMRDVIETQWPTQLTNSCFCCLCCSYSFYCFQQKDEHTKRFSIIPTVSPKVVETTKKTKLFRVGGQGDGKAQYMMKPTGDFALYWKYFTSE